MEVARVLCVGSRDAKHKTDKNEHRNWILEEKYHDDEMRRKATKELHGCEHISKKHRF